MILKYSVALLMIKTGHLGVNVFKVFFCVFACRMWVCMWKHKTRLNIKKKKKKRKTEKNNIRKTETNIYKSK